MWNPENGVMFGDKHSYRDWGMYLKSRPEISPPPPKTVYEDIPGSDGSLDLTESLTGDVKYENRELRFEFKVIGGRSMWYNTYSDIMDYLHGKNVKVIIDEDMSFYYIGRMEADEWESSEITSTVVIKGDVEPYKMELNSSLEDWLWDPFNFETGIVREYKDLDVNGSRTLVVPGRRKHVTPTFIVSSTDGSGMAITFNGYTYTIPDGTSRVVGMVLLEGENVLTIKGNGKISVDYRGGRL